MIFIVKQLVFEAMTIAFVGSNTLLNKVFHTAVSSFCFHSPFPVSYTHLEPTRRTPLYSSAASDVYKRQQLVFEAITVAFVGSNTLLNKVFHTAVSSFCFHSPFPFQDKVPVLLFSDDITAIT